MKAHQRFHLTCFFLGGGQTSVPLGRSMFKPLVINGVNICVLSPFLEVTDSVVLSDQTESEMEHEMTNW